MLYLILSVIAAFALWFILSLTVFPETTVTLRDVPIDYSLTGSYADIAGLSIMTKSADTVNLNITGLRYQIGEYTQDDVHATVNLDSVRAPGQYDLRVEVTSVNGDAITVVQDVQTVKVEFDHLVYKEFSVSDGTLTADYSKVSAAEGYMIDPDEVSINPSQVVLYGPKDYIEQITSCVVEVNNNGVVNQDIRITNTSLKMYNGDSVFESEKITHDVDSFDLNLSVYITKNLKPDIRFNPYFSQFDISSLDGKYTVQPETVMVKGKDQRLLTMNSLSTVGYIDIRQVKIGALLTQSISDTAYYTNISGNNTLTVSFDLEGYTSKSVTVNNNRISVINCPDDYVVSVLTDKITNVTIIGPAESIEQIDGTNIIAERDMMNYNINLGSEMYSVNVYAPDYTDCWAFGRYTVVANIEENIHDVNVVE